MPNLSWIRFFIAGLVFLGDVALAADIKSAQSDTSITISEPLSSPFSSSGGDFDPQQFLNVFRSKLPGINRQCMACFQSDAVQLKSSRFSISHPRAPPRSYSA